jgi:hypothetical protein
MLSTVKRKKPSAQFDFDAPLSPAADHFLAEATAEFNLKQNALKTNWRFGQHKQWGFDQGSGILKLEFADGAELHFDGQILGSYSPSQRSWEWAWNNLWVEPAMARDSKRVKQIGTKFGIAYLQAGLVPLPDGEFVSYLCSIGLKATDSLGVYRGKCEPVDVIILLKNPRWARRASAAA